MFEVQIDATAFADWMRKAANDLRAGARNALGTAVQTALRNARTTQRFNDKSGELRRSIARGQSGPWVQFIRAGSRKAPYANFVEGGTKAHEIRPRRTGDVRSHHRLSHRNDPSGKRKAGSAQNLPRLLRFQIAGRWFSAKVVKHPGTKPTHFMRQAGEAGERMLLDMLERVADRTFR